MSEPQNSDPRRDRRERVAVIAAIATLIVGSIPFGVIFALTTRKGVWECVAYSFVELTLLAFPLGIYCGQLGTWLTRHSTIDSRLMSCSLAALLEFTVLGWLIVIYAPT